MRWTLYLYKDELAFDRDDCYLSPPPVECRKRNYRPLIGEHIRYVETPKDGSRKTTRYEARIVAISHSYTDCGIDISAVITDIDKFV